MFCYIYACIEGCVDVWKENYIPDHNSAERSNQDRSRRDILCDSGLLAVFGRYHIDKKLDGGIHHLGEQHKNNGNCHYKKVVSLNSQNVAQYKNSYCRVKMIPQMPLGLGSMKYALYRIVRAIDPSS